MISLICLFFFLPLTFADSYSDGLGKLDSIQQRTKSLLERAGVSLNPRARNAGLNDKKEGFFRFHALPSSTFIPAGALAFGQTHLRLLVGSETSPVSLIFTHENKYPLLSGAKAIGQASQNRGRIFADFDRLVLRSGKVIPVKGVMLDAAGSLGAKGEPENSRTLEIAGGIGLGLLAAPTDTKSPFGFLEEARKSPTERIKSSLLNESRDYLREQFKEISVLRLDEHTDITIMFNEEVRL